MDGLGVGVTVKHLRAGGVEDLIVPVPAIDEQQIIVKKFKQLLRVCDALEKKLVMERRVSKILAQASIATLTETGQSRKDKLHNMEVA